MIYGLDEYIQLKVLEQYNFTVENHSNGRYTEIHLIRDEICIVYHVWSQFGDNVVFVSDNIQDHHNHIYLGTYSYKECLEAMMLQVLWILIIGICGKLFWKKASAVVTVYGG